MAKLIPLAFGRCSAETDIERFKGSIRRENLSVGDQIGPGVAGALQLLCIIPLLLFTLIAADSSMEFSAVSLGWARL